MAARRTKAVPLSLTTSVGPMSSIFTAKQALSCGVCGLKYQLVDNPEIFRAATASGGDLAKYFVEDE